jgi:hypothetical protein
MYSYRHFTPGKKSNSSRIVKGYTQAETTCACVQDKYDKTSVANNKSNVSKQLQQAHMLKFASGGTVRFGNDHLKQPPTVNYLGRTEGQPGGSGKPPTNRF